MTLMLHQFLREIASATAWLRDLRPTVLLLRGGRNKMWGSERINGEDRLSGRLTRVMRTTWR